MDLIHLIFVLALFLMLYSCSGRSGRSNQNPRDKLLQTRGREKIGCFKSLIQPLSLGETSPGSSFLIVIS